MDNFIRQHKNQLETSSVPKHLWETLYKKLLNTIFDAGEYFEMLQMEDESWRVVVSRDEGIEKSNSEMIFLIDHAWTFRSNNITSQLKNDEKLLQRMANLMTISMNEDSKDSLLTRVSRKIWKYSNTYSMRNTNSFDEQMPLWYIMDEFGSRINHSDDPNFRVIPFYSLLDNLSYSILFPLKSVGNTEEIFRDYVEGPDACSSSSIRKILLFPWHPFNSNVSWTQCEPPSSFFTSSRSNESLPMGTLSPISFLSDSKITVYSDYEVINTHLKHPSFKIVHEMHMADILWLTTHFKEFREFSETFPEKMINQFPFENVVTIKDLLCIVARRTSKEHPKWLPVTYNLKTELPQFLSYFQHRSKKSLDNIWIIKPWNLARGLGIDITDNLDHILRAPFSGPKIAQKYLSDPVLFNRPDIGQVKFDLRYILLLQSLHPTKLFVYNRFWLRFANKAFSLNDFDDYQKHFTVMNYTESAELQQMFCSDFIKEFERQYSGFEWKKLEKDIYKMLGQIFEGASQKEPPSGIAANSQSRAMYAADIMLDWSSNHEEMIPKILEINWGPDCERAVNYYPEFFNDVFSTLFLNKAQNAIKIVV